MTTIEDLWIARRRAIAQMELVTSWQWSSDFEERQVYRMAKTARKAAEDAYREAYRHLTPQRRAVEYRRLQREKRTML